MRFSSFLIFVICSFSYLNPARAATYAGDYYVAQYTELASNGGRVSWSPSGNNLIAYDSMNPTGSGASAGFFDVWTITPQGTGQTCLTCGKAGLPVYNKGNPEWRPQGDYLVFQVQRGDTTYTQSEDTKARPGVGGDNVIYTMDSTGTNFWEVPVSATYTPHNGGVLHPHFSHDGTTLIWAQHQEKDPSPFGVWVIQVCSFAPPSASGGAPVVTLLQSLSPGQPNSLYETHGFSLDDQTIFFSGTASGQTAYGDDIYSYNLTTGAFADLTNTSDEWDEHSIPHPTQEKLIWVSSYGTASTPAGLELDYWTMNYDGSDKKRVTWYEDPLSPMYQQGFVGGDNSWSPDGTQDVIFLNYTGGETSGGANTGAIWLMTFAPSSTTTSGGNYVNFPQAPDSLISSFGSDLASATASATTLSTQLGSTSVTVTDADGVSRDATLLFASPGQVNWIMPSDTAPGPATVLIANGSTISEDVIESEPVAPAIFTADSSGSGPAAAYILLYPNNGGPAINEPVAACSPTCTVQPASLADGQAYLILFATGVRHYQQPLTAYIGPNLTPYFNGMSVNQNSAVSVPVTFAGAQGTFAGLDQINLQLPANLAASGTMYVQIEVDGYLSNAVEVAFQ